MFSFDPEPKTSECKLNFTIQKSEVICFLTQRKESFVVLDNVLSPEECENIRDFIDKTSVFQDRKRKSKTVGLCSEMSREIQQRCSRYIPSTFFFPDSVIKLEGKEALEHCLNSSYWSSPSINECWRFVRCEPGASLGLHFDGKYVPNVDYSSIFTIMVYLSNNEDGALKFSGEEGGTFLPREGRVVIFDQKLLHEGCKNSNMKYYARSEIMYSRSSKIETPDDAEAASLYREACRLHSADPTSSRAKLLEEKSFTLSPLLEKLILNY